MEIDMDNSRAFAACEAAFLSDDREGYSDKDYETAQERVLERGCQNETFLGNHAPTICEGELEIIDKEWLVCKECGNKLLLEKEVDDYLENNPPDDDYDGDFYDDVGFIIVE